MKNGLKRTVCILLVVFMLFAFLPVTVLADTADAVTSTYVKVHSLDEIVPNARYILIGTYENTAGEVTYHAMGKDSYSNGGYRMSYAQDQFGAHNFDISSDTETITLYSYPDADYDPIIKLRLRPYGDDGHRYYFAVDGEGYLCGFASSTNKGTVGHDAHSCMPVFEYTYQTAGEAWWYMRVIDDGDYAGQWQIINRCAFRMGGGNVFCHDIIRFAGPYPNSGAQFRAEEVYTRDVGAIEDGERIKYTEDAKTNIWLYREVCSHPSSGITHVSATPATCTSPGALEYWYCSGCEKYFSAVDFSRLMGVADTYIAPVAHTPACGHTAVDVKFELYPDGGYMSSDMSGERFILLGASGEKFYAMGNETNSDGSRNAIEVTLGENGIITASSDEAEFLTFDYDNGVFGFLVDGCYFSLCDGKVIAYAKEHYRANGYVPNPATFIGNGDVEGGGNFRAYSSLDTENEYLSFDAENVRFVVNGEDDGSTVLYREVCPHEKVHYPAREATCTRCGNVEYWYCDTCYKYFGTADATVTIYETQLSSHATGHNYSDGHCTLCGRETPVYRKITSADELGLDGSYIIAATDGTNTYVLKAPVDEWADLNGNDIPDIEEIDEDGNEIPDYYEKDSDGDGEPDCYDYDYIEQNAIIVVPDSEGNIVVEGLDAAEFEIIIRTPYGGEEAPMDYYPEGDYPEGDFGYAQKDQYLFILPNAYLNGLNEINARGACIYEDEEDAYVDETSFWGISFGNALSESEQTDLDGAKFETGADTAIMYAENCGNGATRPLRLRLYNETVSFVTEYDDWLPGATEATDNDGNPITDEWGNPVYDTNDTQYGVFLYYAPGEYAHIHRWSDWTPSENENEYVRECECGESETMTLPGEENPINGTDSETNAVGAKLENTDIELITSVLTDEEQSKVAAGEATVNIYLEVTDIPEINVSPEEKELIQDVANEMSSAECTAEVAMYLNIDLFKKVSATDGGFIESEPAKVTETSDSVTITVNIPEEHLNSDDSVKRDYSIIRTHDDGTSDITTDVIDGDFDSESNTFTFETDKFSTYALMYVDRVITKYTVQYTDGVDDVEIFADQLYTVEAGTETPPFEGTPERDGYTFDGWTPEVSDTITDNAVYSACWIKNIPPFDADVNGDGDTDPLDVVIYARFIAGWAEYKEYTLNDIDGDGNIGAIDLIIIERSLAGWKGYENN
jgi:hypothetical protein